MKPRCTLAVLTWSGCFLVLGALLWLSFQEPHGQTSRLPDESTVELAAVTFGREHRYIAGNLWQRLQELALPAGSAPTEGHRSTSQEQPVLWLRWSEPGRAADAPFFTRVGATIDEHGCRLLNGDSSFVMSPGTMLAFADSALPSPGYRDLSPVAVDVYPRRSGHFRFGLLTTEKPLSPPLAAYEVALPPGGPFPEWRAGKPPVSARSGPVEVTLASLVRPPAAWPVGGTACATYRYQEQGRPTTNWRPELITVLDATGNTLESPVYATPKSELVGFNGLCWREPAWKLRVRFIRRQPAAAPARFVWRFPALPAPARNHAVDLPVRLPSGPIRLELERMLGGGRITHHDGGVSTYGEPRVAVIVGKLDPRLVLALTRVTNEQGRDLPVPADSFFSLGPDQTKHELPLSYPKGTKQLNLTFGLYETHTVEFLVQP